MYESGEELGMKDVRMIADVIKNYHHSRQLELGQATSININECSPAELYSMFNEEKERLNKHAGVLPESLTSVTIVEE
jgi:hypothetical protein